jgi:hypothetical protein
MPQPFESLCLIESHYICTSIKLSISMLFRILHTLSILTGPNIFLNICLSKMRRLFSSSADWHNIEQQNIAICYKQWIGQNKNKLQQLCCSAFGYSSMWRRVTWLVFPDVSKKGIAFIFMGFGLQEKWRTTHQTVNMKALRLFLNVGKHQFSAAASHLTSVLCCCGLLAMNVGPCHYGMARSQVADGGTAAYMEGSCE